jgi:hypothetical protein
MQSEITSDNVNRETMPCRFSSEVSLRHLFQKGEIMTCTQEPIKMSGVLSGSGLKTACTVSALRVSLSGTRLFKDCMYSILWVAGPLPDGTYKLSVEGKTVDMRHYEGGWQEARLTETP